MLDVDGTIYQSLDLKERAWHATNANSRSIGIEIANIGAYPLKDTQRTGEVVSNRVRTARFASSIPETAKSSRFLPPESSCDRAATSWWWATIQGEKLQQYDFTPQQYDALDQADGHALQDFSEDSSAITRATLRAALITKTLTERRL